MANKQETIKKLENLSLLSDMAVDSILYSYLRKNGDGDLVVALMSAKLEIAKDSINNSCLLENMERK